MINKSKRVLGYIFPSCIILHCGVPSDSSLISDQIQQPIKANNPDEFVNVVNDNCIKQFKDTLSKKKNFYEKAWSNRSKNQTVINNDIKDQKYIDHIDTYVQVLERQIVANQKSLQIINHPKEFLNQKAKWIAEMKDESQQQEYWGNLEFYLAGYAASLFLIVRNSLLEESEKVRLFKEIIDGFYEAYTLAFKLISGIELKDSSKDENRMNFRSMCNAEQNYKVYLFSHEQAGNLDVVIGSPIWIMESLALLKKHPQTGKPATMANLGRGKDVVGANDIQSIKGFENNAFLASFSLNFCDYVRRVIDEINNLLFLYQIGCSKVHEVQEHSKFLFKDFREIIDQQKNEILVFDKMVEKKEDNTYFFIYPNQYTKSENNKFSFISYPIDNLGNYDKEEVKILKQKRALFQDLLKIDVVKIGNEIVCSADKNKDMKQNGRIPFTNNSIKTLS